MNSKNSGSRNFRLDWDTDGRPLLIIITLLVMLGFAIHTYLQVSNSGEIDRAGGEQEIVLDRRVDEEVSERDREFNETIRLLHENLRMLKEIQATLDLLVSRLDIRVEPKEQAGVAPSTGERGERP